MVLVSSSLPQRSSSSSTVTVTGTTTTASTGSSTLWGLLRFAFVLRCILIVWGIFTAYIGKPYDTSLSITHDRLYLIPSEATSSSSSSFSSSSSWSLPSSLFGIVSPFLHWDSVYFLYIAQYGYTYAQFHAFFPLYPFLIYIVRMVLFYPFEYLGIWIEDTSYRLAALWISNGSYFGAIVMLYRLTFTVFSHHSGNPNSSVAEYIAYLSTLFFIITPSSIFMTAGYTESLYSLFSFTGMYLLENDIHHQVFLRPSSRYSLRSYAFSLFLATLCFTLAAGVRSNGFLLSGYILYGFIVQLLRLSYRTTVTPSYTSFQLRVRLLILTVITVGSCGTILLPYILFQRWSGTDRYCYATTIDSNHAMDTHYLSSFSSTPPNPSTVPPWCNTTNIIPPMYNTIQELYWNVGLWKYWEWKHLGMFILPLPTFLIVLRSFVYKISDVYHQIQVTDIRCILSYLHQCICYGDTVLVSGNVASKDATIDGNPVTDATSSGKSSFTLRQRRRSSLAVSIKDFPSPESDPTVPVSIPSIPKYVGIFRSVPYILHSIVLITIAILVMNVQVTTRFLVACPSLYWYITIILFLPYRTTKAVLKDTVSSGPSSSFLGSLSVPSILQGLYFAYSIFYLFIGTALFVNFYNWT